MSGPLRKASTALMQADATSAMSHRDPVRTANVIAEHGELREVLRNLLEFHEGFEEEHRAVVKMVYALLGTLIASSNGQTNWMTELPPGTAPQFRRALNELTQYMRDSSR